MWNNNDKRMIDIKEWVCNFLNCNVEKQDIPAPSPLEELDVTEVNTLLKSEFPKATLLLSDEKYKTTTKKELERYLEEDLTDKWNYIPTYFDCDDFSYALMGHLSNPDWGCLAFGILWTKVPGGAHAVNCFISNSHRVYIVEPQNDKIFSLPDNWEPYLVMM